MQYIVLFFITVLLNGQVSEYYNHNKWKTDIWSDERKLSDKPLEITEISYTALTDSNLNPHTKEINNYQFNSDGELIYKRTSSRSDSFWTITKSTINENGYQSISINHNAFKQEDDTSVTRSRNLKNGQFLQVNFWTYMVPFYRLKIFEDNGSVEKTIAIKDTNNFKKIIWTAARHYQNDLIQSCQTTQENEISIERYFYSSKNFIDSIYYTSNGKLTHKKLFINNEQGDVIKYLLIENINDTSVISTYRYEYDKHNNWIKRWKIMNDRHKYTPIHLFYLYREREIKYAQ